MSQDHKISMAERLASLSPKKRALLELQLKKKGILTHAVSHPCCCGSARAESHPV